MSVDLVTLLIALLVITLSSTVQGSVGFGANLLAAPMLALIDTDLVPGPIFLASISLSIATAMRERDHVDVSFVGWAISGRVPGVVAGAVVLSLVSDTSLQLLVGFTILVAIVLSSGIIVIPESRLVFAAAGATSGFGATTASIGGPPVALSMQHRSGPQMRSTMATYFLLGAPITLPAMAVAGRLGSAEILTGLALMPASLLGFALSGPIRPHVDAGRLRPIVLTVSTASAVALLLRVAL